MSSRKGVHPDPEAPLPGSSSPEDRRARSAASIRRTTTLPRAAPTHWAPGSARALPDPEGERIVFAWTRGYEIGNYNIFLVDVASGKYTQLTHSAGRNEHPYFAPSGTHIVFSTDRLGGIQIWTMRADGTQLKQLTSRGRNETPVWALR